MTNSPALPLLFAVVLITMATACDQYDTPEAVGPGDGSRVMGDGGKRIPITPRSEAKLDATAPSGDAGDASKPKTPATARPEEWHQAAEQEFFPGFVGIEALKKTQAEHLRLLKSIADRGDWDYISSHRPHPPTGFDGGFDWWMFPIDRTSSYGQAYAVGSREIAALKKDTAFMKSYRDGVILVAKSWGWDLEHNKDITNAKQRWVGYDVRLAKMLHSIRLFGQKDLFDRLLVFIREHKVQLEPKYQKYLQPL